MWWRTSATIRVRSATGQRSRSRKCAGQLGADRRRARGSGRRHGRRLADVVEQRGQPDRAAGRGRRRRPPAGCGPTGPRPATLFWGTPRWAASSGEIVRQEPRVVQEPQPGRRPLGGQELGELGGDPLARQVPRRARPWPRCRPASRPRSRSRASWPAERRGPSAARPPRTARRGSPTARSDRAARSARPSYGSTSDGAAPGLGAPGHRVDREVAPGQVELERRAELDPVRPAEVGVVVVGPEGRDLDVVDGPGHRSGPRPCRTRSRRRRPGRAPRVCSGSADVARSQFCGDRPSSDVAHGARRRHTPRTRRTTASPRMSWTAAGIAAGRSIGERPASSVSSAPGTGTSARPRCARRPGTA